MAGEGGSRAAKQQSQISERVRRRRLNIDRRSRRSQGIAETLETLPSSWSELIDEVLPTADEARLPKSYRSHIRAYLGFAAERQLAPERPDVAAYFLGFLVDEQRLAPTTIESVHAALCRWFAIHEVALGPAREFREVAGGVRRMAAGWSKKPLSRPLTPAEAQGMLSVPLVRNPILEIDRVIALTIWHGRGAEAVVRIGPARVASMSWDGVLFGADFVELRFQNGESLPLLRHGDPLLDPVVAWERLRALTPLHSQWVDGLVRTGRRGTESDAPAVRTDPSTSPGNGMRHHYRSLAKTYGFPMTTGGRSVFSILDSHQMRRLMLLWDPQEVTYRRDQALITTSIWGGFRGSEPLLLTRDQTVIRNDRVTIERGTGKDDIDGRTRHRRTLLATGDEMCPRQALLDWYDVVNAAAPDARDDGLTLVFPGLAQSSNIAMPLRPTAPGVNSTPSDALTVAFRRRARAAGIADAEDLSSHTARYTWLSWAEAAGVDPTMAAEHVGHRSLGSTLRYMSSAPSGSGAGAPSIGEPE